MKIRQRECKNKKGALQDDRRGAPKRPGLNPIMEGPVKAFAAADCSWPFPPEHLRLGAEEVHVWCAALDGIVCELSPLAETLSACEHRRAERFQFDRDRIRFIARRGLLRVLLGRYLRADPVQIEFCY
ncbi:MAG TPA: hypothetical protein VN887_11535, partial [Candidatus Angelobacter sp.]|nr:hypothetical protein [Candidatus Angelobacter sp.]